MTLLPVAVRSAEELDSAFAAIMSERAEAFLMTADPLHQRSIRRIIDFLTHNRLPGMFLTREVVVAGESAKSWGSLSPYRASQTTRWLANSCRVWASRVTVV
jgi:hypothetical protein